MKLPIELGPGAQEDFDDAVWWYEAQRSGLGIRLTEQVNRTLMRVKDSPRSFPVIEGSAIRQAVVEKFPFTIIFVIETERIYVYSIFHTSRNPVIWRGRID